MTSLSASSFEGRMAPERPDVDPPITWAGWWDYATDKTVTVPGVGEVTKVISTEEPDSDSYSYNRVRTMIFRVGQIATGARFFRVSKSSSSFDSYYEDNEAWEYADVEEVYPETIQATQWIVVRR
jgi:hypothetical protein